MPKRWFDLLATLLFVIMILSYSYDMQYTGYQVRAIAYILIALGLRRFFYGDKR